jgi:hypothetical protein
VDWSFFLLTVQTICAVAAVVFPAVEAIRRVRRWRRTRNLTSAISSVDRVLSRESESAMASEDRSPPAPLTSCNVVVTVGLVIVITTALFVDLSHAALVYGYSGGALTRSGIALLILIGGLIWVRSRHWAGELAIIELAGFEIFDRAVGDSLITYAGFMPLAVIVLATRFARRPAVQGITFAIGAGLAWSVGSELGAIAIALFAILYGIGTLSRRSSAWVWGPSASALIWLFITRASAVESRFTQWLVPRYADPQDGGWHIDQYLAALRTSRALGPSSFSSNGVPDVTGLGWPIFLAMRLGWVPAGILVLIAVVFVAFLVVSAVKQRKTRTAGLGLTGPPAVFLILNLLIVIGVLPTFSVVSLPFASDIGLSGGAIWLLIAAAYVLKSDFWPDKDPLPPRQDGEGTFGPERWTIRSLLVYFGLADEAAEAQSSTGRQRRTRKQPSSSPNDSSG